MRQRIRWLLAAAVVAATLLVGVPAVGRAWSRAAGPPAEPDCAADVAAAERVVHTDRRFTDADLPGIGAYLTIHWQVRALGDPCGRAPGPTDYAYQGVVRLRPRDTLALTGGYDWRPEIPGPTPATGAGSDPAPTGSPGPGPGAGPAGEPIWAPLVPHVPAGLRWLYTDDYPRAHLRGAHRGRLYLANHAHLAFFVLTTR